MRNPTRRLLKPLFSGLQTLETNEKRLDIATIRLARGSVSEKNNNSYARGKGWFKA